MRASKSMVLSVVAVSLLGGCATHNMMAMPVPPIAESGLINDPRQASRLEKAMSDESISRLLEMDVRAKLPTRLAVSKYYTGYDGSLDLREISAEELKQWESVIPDKKLITGVQHISDLMVERDPEKNQDALTLLRTAAAKTRCELLLVYAHDDGRVNNYNDLAALYWTFVGLWLVPGNVLEHRTIMQAVIIDCRTGAILGTAIADTHLKQLAPLALMSIASDKMGSEAPKKTLADLQAGCKAVLEQIVKRAVGQEGAE